MVRARNDNPYGAGAGSCASASLMSDGTNVPRVEFRFQHLTTFPPATMQQIEAIYAPSFPPNERKPFWLVSDAMQQGRYNVFVMSRDQGIVSEIVAFALLVRLRTSQAMYIEYLAVAPALRGQGIGSLLFRSMTTFLKSTDSSAIVWEVDPPVQAGDDNERRIRFYQRLGAHLIEQSKRYGMPNYYKGSGILPLRMMWQPLHHDHVQPTKSELITFITDIYETEYRGQDNLRDEIIANLDRP